MSVSYFMLRFLRNKRKKIHGTEILNEREKSHASDSKNVIMCRICLKAGITPIYDSDLPFDVQEAIRTFGDIEITLDDSYPKHLCEPCQSLLVAAVSFRKSAKESDEILRRTWSVNASTPTEFKDDLVNFSFETKFSENPHKCKTCNMEFSTLEEYAAHKTTKLHKNVRVQCPICHRLLTPKLYRNHVSKHQSTSQLICDICGKLYRKDNLTRHLQLHSYDLPFQCKVCPYRGRFIESLRIHMRTHSGEKPFSCDKCELQFITRSNLNRHLLTHRKEKPHKCKECGRGFYTKRDVDVHYKVDHYGMKDFGCRICGNKYSTRKAIMRHELRVHKRDKMATGRMPLYLQAEYRKVIK